MRNTLANLLVSSVRQTSNGAIFPMLSRHRLHVECVLDPRKHSLLSLDFNYKPVFLYSQSFIGMKKIKAVSVPQEVSISIRLLQVSSLWLVK